YDHSYDRSQEHSLPPLRYPRSSPLLTKSGYQHPAAAPRKAAFRTRLPANDVTAFFYLSPTSANATTSSFLVNYSAPRTFGITGIWRY
ncbi:hypothetical protein, partial [Sphingopyxis granuli]|uniref:hypothetical protein n=1 Tax=Sphingopyxis granuli TaxID=267128 RepID=UPI00301CDA4C